MTVAGHIVSGTVSGRTLARHSVARQPLSSPAQMLKSVIYGALAPLSMIALCPIWVQSDHLSRATSHSEKPGLLKTWQFVICVETANRESIHVASGAGFPMWLSKRDGLITRSLVST